MGCNKDVLDILGFGRRELKIGRGQNTFAMLLSWWDTLILVPPLTDFSNELDMGGVSNATEIEMRPR